MTPISRTWADDWEVRDGGGRRSLWRRASAPQLFVGSFLLLIGFGTLGLKALPGLYTGEPLTWLDALFTATSAVCVTGLIVVDTASFFTPAGQGFILLLIQLGGLGMITFTTLIIIALGRRLSLRQETITASSAEVAPHVEFQHLARDVVLFTLALEAIGAVALYLLWIPEMGFQGALWPAIFHAVSAFCNAGFSTNADSLMGYATAPFTLVVVMALIVLGGIGFLTLEELYLLRRSRREERAFFRLSLHSRIVLASSAVLLVGGWILFALFEWRVTLAELPVWARPLNALFMSVTARTAGFNTIDYAQAADSSNFLTILLMSIGGSPGSTAGGIKTTTVALILLLAWARLRGMGITNLWGRSVPEETVQRAVGLFVVAFGLVTIAIFAYTSTELGPFAQAHGSGFLRYMFEAVSAFNTVGLSMGATTDLSTPGRWITIILMYVGRVGPLTFAAAIALRGRSGPLRFRYAYEDVVVG